MLSEGLDDVRRAAGGVDGVVLGVSREQDVLARESQPGNCAVVMPCARRVVVPMGLLPESARSRGGLCVDEKSQVQALARSQPAFPMMPGMPEKRTHGSIVTASARSAAAASSTIATIETGQRTWGPSLRRPVRSDQTTRSPRLRS